VLGSLHLPAFASEKGEIDFGKLSDAVRDGIRFLDDVVEINVYPDEAIARATRRTRKVGLGVMGLADLFLMRGMRYGSPESLAVARDVMGSVERAAREATVALSEERGPYPAWQGEGTRRRNATVLAIAPTGTLRLLVGCSGGMEPFLRPVVTVRSPEGTWRWVDPWLDEWLGRRLREPEGVLASLEADAPAADLRDLEPEDRELVRRAWELAPEEQILLQAEVQRFVDGAVSKTIHLPSTISPSRILDLVQLAHRAGCKGAAFFRRGSEPPLSRGLPAEVDVSPPCCL
jgi:ribonucleoside-diphosphate reductase alpha chain